MGGDPFRFPKSMDRNGMNGWMNWHGKVDIHRVWCSSGLVGPFGLEGGNSSSLVCLFSISISITIVSRFLYLKRERDI